MWKSSCGPPIPLAFKALPLCHTPIPPRSLALLPEIQHEPTYTSFPTLERPQSERGNCIGFSLTTRQCLSCPLRSRRPPPHSLRLPVVGHVNCGRIETTYAITRKCRCLRSIVLIISAEKKKTSFSSFFKSFKNKRSKKDKQQQSNEANGKAKASPTRQSEKVPIINNAGRDETSPLQRIPSNGGQESNSLNTPTSAAAYTLPQPEPTGSFSSIPHANGDTSDHGHGSQMLMPSNKSTAPTCETTPDTVNSDTGHSKSGSNLPGGGMSSRSGGGSNSVFSSSNHSSRSLTTTLTTIQSTAPSAHLQNNVGTGAQQAAIGAAHGHQHQPSHTSSIYFQHQYPTTPNVSAVPQHLQTPSNYAPCHLPTTYRSATANNLLTDNASILTLASSSQQAGRRNSLDTTASVRAIPPSSQWGGSRESLPLSMVSQSADAPGGATGGHGHGPASSRPSLGGIPAQERNSIYSSQSNAPVLSSERNSIYTGRTGTAGGASTHNTISDNASLKERGVGDDHGSLRADDRSSLRAADAISVGSGMGGMSHSRNDSVTNSIGGSVEPPSVAVGMPDSGAGTGAANSPAIPSSKDLQ